MPDRGECGDEEVCEFPKTSCVIVGSSCLSQFLVCMVIGTLLMLRTGVSAAVARPKVNI